MENKANQAENHQAMHSLTSGSLLARNTVLNILFQAIPVIIALITIPVLIKGLGTDRFGVLSIAWIVMGYFSLFDFGIARVLIKMIGERLAAGNLKDIPPLFWTGMTMMALLGVIMSLVVFGLSRVFVYKLLNIPPELQSEALVAFWAIAVTVPLVITNAALWGSMEAKQSFIHVNSVKTLNSVFTLVLPIIALHFTRHIGYIVFWLTAGRLVLWFLSFGLLLSVLDVLKTGYRFSKAHIKPILQLGGWMTISNIISPLMVYFDRFLIGVLITISAVTFYVTPYEVVTKLLLVPMAMTRVLFPAFSASYGLDPGRATRIYEWGRKLIWMFIFPVTILIIGLAPQGLNLWVGPEFVEKSTRVMQFLAIGILFNAPAQVAFALIQGSGRPDISGKIHLLELPMYLLLFWLLVSRFGINGAALAWAIRVTVDALLMIHFSERLLDVIPRKFTFMLVVTALTLVPLFFIQLFLIKLCYMFILIAGMVIYAIRVLHGPDVNALVAVLRKKYR